MSRSNRSVVPAVAGLAIVASGLWLLVRDLSAVDSAYRHSAADASIKYQRDAQAYMKERCFSPAGLREIDCASKAEEAAREGQRKEQDLAAQNITAWWTKVMGIAAMIGMALSAVGVWLIKATFDETKASVGVANAALTHARDATERQLRAYIGIESIGLGNADQPVDRFNLQIKNFGQTPAKAVTLECSTLVVGLTNTPDMHGHDCPALVPLELPPQQTMARGLLFSKSGYATIHNTNSDVPITLKLRVKLRYGDVFGRTYETDYILSSEPNQIASRSAGVEMQTPEREIQNNG